MTRERKKTKRDENKAFERDTFLLRDERALFLNEIEAVSQSVGRKARDSNLFNVFRNGNESDAKKRPKNACILWQLLYNSSTFVIFRRRRRE